MLSEQKLDKYAELALTIGANVQKGQPVVIRSDVSAAAFAERIAQKAYALGASKVSYVWSDEKVKRLDVDVCPEQTLTAVPEYEKAMWKEMVDAGSAFVTILSENPDNYANCDSERLNKYLMSIIQSRQTLRQATMTNKSRWVLVAVPSPSWAKRVFPDCDEQCAVEKLWNAIAKTMRLDESDPVAAWKKHIETMDKRAAYLTKCNFEYIHFTNAKGTDLTVGLAIGHIWISAGEKAQDGLVFTANMPTEEIFTAPHKYKVNGIVKNALPLVDGGAVIDDFSLTFKDGKVVDFSAKKGYDALKSIIEADQNSCRIGEISLIGKKSPISESGFLFYNTLFDENASCHLALGKAYPTTVSGGNDMDAKQADEVGLNDSVMHVDFMIGTKDVNVEGISFDGSKKQLFVDGEWVI